MKIESENIYHIFNRGNNREPIFFERRNFYFFIDKIKSHLLNHADLLCYCLMPNHFHIQIFAGKNFHREKFSNQFKIMLSSYTRAINIQESRTGSLFQQNSKSKNIAEGKDENYSRICFHYNHQNPLKAHLVSKLEDWEFSSFREYAGLAKESICNQWLAKKLLSLPESSYRVDTNID